MPPVENMMGAAAIGAMTYFASTHVALTPYGAAAVRVVGTLMSIGILAVPYFS